MRSQKSITIGIKTRQMAMPQTHSVIARSGSTYLKEGVAHAAPTKKEADLTRDY